MLGHKPTKAQTKGNRVPLPKPGRFRGANTDGRWLHAADSEPASLDSQIEEILGKLTSDQCIWNKIASAYTLDLFCGLFMDEIIEGIGISAENMLAVGRRHILIDLDIYATDEE